MKMPEDSSRRNGIIDPKRRAQIIKSYWQDRRHFQYYRAVKRWIEHYPTSHCILDVGSRGTPVATWGRFTRRISLDRSDTTHAFDGRVECVVSDWLKWQSPLLADLVTCLQVLEHLPNDTVEGFARKLLRSGRTVFVSVHYLWAKAVCASHRQDPVSLKKLESWMGKRSRRHTIVRDHMPRLIAAFDGDSKA